MDNVANENDILLVENYLKGDEKSLEILIGRYLNPIYNFVYKYLRDPQSAEDIAQEVFVKVWRNIKKFNTKKNFKTWVFAIAKNTALDFIKKKKSVPFSEFENEEGENIFAETLADPSPLPDEIFEREDVGRVLNEAVEKLSPKYRAVLFLHYNDHFTFREIADILGEPLDTVKSRHRRALILLKKFLIEM